MFESCWFVADSAGNAGMCNEIKKNSSLKTYRAKRSFDKTPEPSGLKKKKPHGEKLLFVVQKHAASHLHYDFRLAINGVLSSWAVPKGFSLDPQQKHLAVQTEDHPYDYAHFEGEIPAGEYGGGTVMVWDIGTYQNIKTKSMESCLKEGRIEVWLEGKKLHGGFALVRMNFQDRRKQWLLIKMDDEYADRKRVGLPKSWDKSALTGRTMLQIKREES